MPLIHILPMQKAPSLHSLLTWAHDLYAAELPILAHSVALTDEGGAPVMSHPAKWYLGLAGPRCWTRDPKRKPTIEDKRIHADCGAGCVIEPDDFRRKAYGVDRDSGLFLTPLHRAIEELSEPDRRLFVKWLVTEALRPTDVATAFGIPAWCAGDVMRVSLTMLRRSFRERPETQWISGRSDSQRTAESAA